MISGRDVAKFANVSQSTVSRAYRENVYIDPATRERVLEAGRKLGYYPNFSSRSLRNKQSHIIGLMLTDPENEFFSLMTEIIGRIVLEKGYQLVLTYNDEDPKKERSCLESLISSRVDGILCMPVSTENADMYNVMNNNGISAIQLIRPLYGNMNTVTVNDELGAYIATKYLLDQGHRKIIITDYSFNKLLPAKVLGYRRACEEYGVDPEQGILDLPFDSNIDGLIAGALASTGATAIISATLPITLATLKACDSCEKKVPGDISLIAYDDSQWLEFLGITVITHPMMQICESISDILFSNINERLSGRVAGPKSMSVKPYLLLRKSVKNI